MLTSIRKNQQSLMLVIAILTIVAFIWLYNRTNLTQVGSNDVASVYGRVVQKAEVDREVRGYRLALALGLTDFVRDLGGMGENEDLSLSDYILNLMVIHHQAEELGIHPSDNAVASVIKGLPSLQTDGAFDPSKYASFIQNQLAPNGFTERQLEEIVRDSVRVRELRHVITSPVAIGEAQIREAARIYQGITATVLRFDREAFSKEANVSNEEVATFYTKNKQSMLSAETRDATYVTFELPVADQKLSGKEKAAALQKLADQAEQALKSIRGDLSKGSSFEKAAQDASLHPVGITALERDGSVKGKDAGLPASVVSTVFRLQGKGELSDIIQEGDTFYVVSVKGVTASHQLELTEVSERLAGALKREKEAKLCSDFASKTLAKVRTELAAGKSLGEIAKADGIKLIPLAGIIPSSQKNSREEEAYATASLGLKEGELGGLQPAPWGSFAVHLEKRTPLSDELWKEHQASLAKSLLSNDQDLLFMDWLRSSRAAAQIKMIGGRGRGQGAGN